MPDSFNSEEDGPLFLHMAGKLDKRNDKSGQWDQNVQRCQKSGPVTPDDNDCIIVQRFKLGNNTLRIDTSGPNLMDRKETSQPQKAGVV